MRLGEWLAFLAGAVICAVFFVPWDFILGSWWQALAFVAFPAFIWLVSGAWIRD